VVGAVLLELLVQVSAGEAALGPALRHHDAAVADRKFLAETAAPGVFPKHLELPGSHLGRGREISTCRSHRALTELDTEFRALTTIGNEFTIRHHELGRPDVPDDPARDYLGAGSGPAPAAGRGSAHGGGG
jgi:hypothetical protein